MQSLLNGNGKYTIPICTKHTYILISEYKYKILSDNDLRCFWPQNMLADKYQVCLFNQSIINQVFRGMTSSYKWSTVTYFYYHLGVPLIFTFTFHIHLTFYYNFSLFSFHYSLSPATFTFHFHINSLS